LTLFLVPSQSFSAPLYPFYCWELGTCLEFQTIPLFNWLRPNLGWTRNLGARQTSCPFAYLVCLFAYLHCLFVTYLCCLFIILVTLCAYLVCLLLHVLPTLCSCFVCPLCHLLRMLLYHLFLPDLLLSPIFACFYLFHHLFFLALVTMFVSWPIRACSCLLCYLLHCFASLHVLSLVSAMVTSTSISLIFACFAAYLPTLLFFCSSFKLTPLSWCFFPSLFVQEVEHKRHDNPTF